MSEHDTERAITPLVTGQDEKKRAEHRQRLNEDAFDVLRRVFPDLETFPTLTEARTLAAKHPDRLQVYPADCGVSFIQPQADGSLLLFYACPGEVYRATDPRALELLSPFGLDHFPSIDEAHRLAAVDSERIFVEVEAVSSAYVLQTRGLLVFVYPDGEPPQDPE